jgi:hypothetical protein
MKMKRVIDMNLNESRPGDKKKKFSDILTSRLLDTTMRSRKEKRKLIKFACSHEQQKLIFSRVANNTPLVMRQCHL